MSLLTTRKFKQTQKSPRPKDPPEVPMTPKNAWEHYNEETELIDCERGKEWLEHMNGILILAALFASFISAFMIELLRRVEPDPMDTIQDVLIYQTQMMRNSTLGPYVPRDFSPPEHIVIVNALFYASLGAMLLAAFIAMLIKSWLRQFNRRFAGISLPEQRAKTREFWYLGMKRWRLPWMVEILPYLVHLSLLLFYIGLNLFLSHVSTPSFRVTTAFFGIGVLYYAVTTSISVFFTSSPFGSPLSRALARGYRNAHFLFSLVVEKNMLLGIDKMPATALGLVRWSILTILRTSRPYPPQFFERPIANVTADEVQLSTVASVLRRIHDNAPNSQHSQELHWSVWQLAGSTTFNAPTLFKLPSWILEKAKDEMYFSRHPPAMLVALLAVSLRGPDRLQLWRMTTVRALLQRMEISNVPGAQVVLAAFDHLSRGWNSRNTEDVRQAESNLTNVIRTMGLSTAELLWLVSTLSERHCLGEEREKKPFLIEICLTILSSRALKRGDDRFHDMELLEAVVTLAAMSCSLRPDQLRGRIITNCHGHPWFLQNAQNPALFANWFDDTPPDYHKHIISLLFLVASVFIRRGSYPLAFQYLTVITAKGDLPLHTSALIAVAPVIEGDSLFAISRMLLTAGTQEFEQIDRRSTIHGAHNFQGELLENYDRRLGANENPDPNFLAIVFMLSRHVPSYEIEGSRNLNLDLENPWLGLVARVVARLDIPDGPGLPMGPFHDHRLHNMIAALSLLRYTQGTVTRFTELLLESFLESRELSISSVALEYYLKTAISHLEPPAISHPDSSGPSLLDPPRPPHAGPPTPRLSMAVSAAFNPILADHPLWMGWEMLRIFVDGSEILSVEWRRSFAVGFFTLSRRPLLKPRGDTELVTWESELKQILTWEYFHEEEQNRERTDSVFSGMDWMAMAWSLHLSRHSGRKGKVKSRNLGGPVVNEEFVLRALCKLLDAAPSYQLIPIIPKLCEFLQWFDDPGFPEYRRTIATRIREAVRIHEKFHCMWYI